jgi:orotate phosphoribosyltransferase
VNNTFFDGARVFIVDDVVTSMETKYEFVQKIDEESESRGIQVQIVGLGIAVDREQTTALYDESGNIVLGKRGANPISEFTSRTGIPFFSVVGIREIVEYVYEQRIPLLISKQKRAMDEATKTEFDNYLATYGRE